MIVMAASRAWLAAAIASPTSSAAGPGELVLGYSNELRARRMRLKDLKARTVAPNWATTASCRATWPPRLVARTPWARRLAALLRSAPFRPCRGAARRRRGGVALRRDQR